MVQATFHFPQGFLWGCATSSHQVEGNNTNNNWWAWEQEPGRIMLGHKSGIANDWWSGRWREDFDRAVEGRQNAHRLSIEWSRIQPSPQRWDESALDRYREMVRGLIDRGITPLVTLHHFSDPQWIKEFGGWENEAIADSFAVYVRKVVEALNEYVNLWITINEPNVLAVGAYLLGRFPPGKTSTTTTLRVMVNLVRAHARAYHIIHKIQPTARVGIATNYRGFKPAKAWSPLDRWAAGIQSRVFNDFFPHALATGSLRFPAWLRRIPEAKGTQDFLGVNYYTRDHVAFSLLNSREFFGRRFSPETSELSDSGDIANVPQGMFEALEWAMKFNLPIIVTENGIDNADDIMRRKYLIQHIHQVWKAVNNNYPVKGYFHWTLIDNFEWDRGWTQRFGLWELDLKTQVRRKRPSAEMFAEICQTNGISSETVAHYAPEIFNLLFPI